MRSMSEQIGPSQALPDFPVQIQIEMRLAKKHAGVFLVDDGFLAALMTFGHLKLVSWAGK